MSRPTLLIGAGGFLGRALGPRLEHDRPLLRTHRTRRADRSSRRFELGSPLPCEDPPEQVILLVPSYRHTELRALADLLRRWESSPVLLMSSDVVFAGTRGHYRERDTPDSPAPRGRKLAEAERMVLATGRGLVVRTSYLYRLRGELDSRLRVTRDALLRGEWVQRFDDMWKSPVAVDGAADALAQLVRERRRGLVHLPGPRMRVVDFHRRAMRTLGLPSENIVGMPRPPGVLRDTSLVSENL